MEITYWADFPKSSLGSELLTMVNYPFLFILEKESERASRDHKNPVSSTFTSRRLAPARCKVFHLISRSLSFNPSGRAEPWEHRLYGTPQDVYHTFPTVGKANPPAPMFSTLYGPQVCSDLRARHRGEGVQNTPDL